MSICDGKHRKSECKGDSRSCALELEIEITSRDKKQIQDENLICLQIVKIFGCHKTITKQLP